MKHIQLTSSQNSRMDPSGRNAPSSRTFIVSSDFILQLVAQISWEPILYSFLPRIGQGFTAEAFGIDKQDRLQPHALYCTTRVSYYSVRYSSIIRPLRTLLSSGLVPDTLFHSSHHNPKINTTKMASIVKALRPAVQRAPFLGQAARPALRTTTCRAARIGQQQYVPPLFFGVFV